MSQKVTPGEERLYDEVDRDSEKESEAEDSAHESDDDDDEGSGDDGLNENEEESEDENDDEEWEGSEDDGGDDVENKEEEGNETEHENLDEVVTGAGSEEERGREKDDGIADEVEAADKNGTSEVKVGDGVVDYEEEESSEPIAEKPASPDFPGTSQVANAKINNDAHGENVVPVEVKSLDVAPKMNAEVHSSTAQKKRPGPVHTWHEELNENHGGRRKRSKSQTDGDSSPARLKDPPELLLNQKKTAKGGREKTQRKSKSAQANVLSETTHASATMEKFAQNNQQKNQADVSQFLPANNFWTNQSHQLRGLWHPTKTNIPPQFYPYQMAQTTKSQPMRPIPLSPAYICTPLIPNDICAPYRMAYFRVMERKRHEEQEKNTRKGCSGGEGGDQEKQTQTSVTAKPTLEEKVTPGMMC